MDGKVLMIVDPQMDFISGTLSVAGAADAMDALADYVKRNSDTYDIIVVTSDWHPEEHCSFEKQGGKWPAHCVAETPGAAIWPALKAALDKSRTPVVYLYKGASPDKEEYSIFKAPAEARKLQRLFRMTGTRSVDICGIAGDVCVAATLEDAMKHHKHMKFNILPEYTPSIDGGATISRLMESL